MLGTLALMACFPGQHHDATDVLASESLLSRGSSLGQIQHALSGAGIARYAPGDPMPDFQVSTNRGTLDYSSHAGAGKKVLLPLVVMVGDEADPFLLYMAKDPVTVRDFLGLDPLPEASFLFLSATSAAWQALMQTRIQAQLQQMSPGVQAFWHKHLYFGNSTLDAMKARGGAAATLPGVLDSFASVSKYVRFWSGTLNRDVDLTRLDCNFQWSMVQGPNNHSPGNPIGAQLMYVNVPNACQVVAGDANGTFALVLEQELDGCTAEDAVRRVAKHLANLKGVIVMAKQGSSLRVLGEQDYADGVAGPDPPITATMVTYHPLLLADARRGGVSILYGYNNTSPGSFLVVDANGLLQEIGYPINPWLRMLGWSGQYWAYRKALQHSRSKPAASVPIMKSLAGPGTVAVDLSTFGPLRDEAYAALFVDAELSCAGTWNIDCPIWDHVGTLTVHCGPGSIPNHFLDGAEPGGSFLELARYVTPYRLRVGQWSTDITALAPLLSMEGCTFNITTPPWGTAEWRWSFTLRATKGSLGHLPRGSARDAGGLPRKGAHLFSNNEPAPRQCFNASYNEGREREVAIPPGTGRVELVAIITGHGEDETGCCEFLPSRHVFTLGDHDFAVEFLAPLGLFDCTRPAAGVEPNGYGGWWMGRNGWCNGHAVKPWVVDVTPAVRGGGRIVAKYRGFAWNASSSSWVEPYAASGYILMSSQLAFYSGGSFSTVYE